MHQVKEFLVSKPQDTSFRSIHSTFGQEFSKYNKYEKKKEAPPGGRSSDLRYFMARGLGKKIFQKEQKMPVLQEMVRAKTRQRAPPPLSTGNRNVGSKTWKFSGSDCAG